MNLRKDHYRKLVLARGSRCCSAMLYTSYVCLSKSSRAAARAFERCLVVRLRLPRPSLALWPLRAVWDGRAALVALKGRVL